MSVDEMQDVPKSIADTLELTDMALDGTAEVIEVVRNNPVALIAVGVVGLVAGGVGGYFIAKKKLQANYEQLATEEIADAKAFYANLNKVSEDGEVLSPQDVMTQRHGAEAAAEALRTYRGQDEDGYPEGEPYDEIVDEEQIQKIERTMRKKDGDVIVEEKVETRNVFADPTFDIEEEMKYRTDDKPYIITHDEFYAGEKDYDTLSFTYYEVDDTLTDEHDKPIDDINGTIGDDHLVRFGSGSKDKNTVFIRNDKLACDYEVIKSSGSYLEEVLGMEAAEENTLKHSDQRDRRRAFRHGDG